MRRIGLVQVCAAAVLWGTGGLVVTLLHERDGLGAMTVSAWRMALATLALLLFAAITRRGRSVVRTARTQPVLAVVGDGGFSMNAQELETAARVGARFVTVVLEDGSYSLIKLAQENRKLEPYRMDFGPIDTVKMAEACGVRALRTADPDELATAARQAVDDRRSLVLAVPVNDADYTRIF